MVFPKPFHKIEGNSGNGIPVAIAKKILELNKTKKGCSLNRVVPNTIQIIASDNASKEKVIISVCFYKK